MNYKIKKSICSILLASMLITSLPFAAGAEGVVSSQGATLSQQSVEELTAYTTYDRYNYRLSKPFDYSPDTFMAWIRMTPESVGGTLMSNDKAALYSYVNDGTAEWYVNALGQVGFKWNRAKFQYLFNNEPVNDGTWHHITVSRNPETHVFTLYIDGKKADEVTCVQPDLKAGKLPMNIGVSYLMSTYPTTKYIKQAFEGDIRQVTVYTGAVSADRVVEDMNSQAPANDNGGTLLGNWNLGESWTERNVSDSSSNLNDATLVTFDRYVSDATEDYEYDYAFVVIPDTQTSVHRQPEDFDYMTTWLAENTDDLNLKFMLQVGDLSDVGSNLDLYQQCAAGFDKLNGILPYSFVQGNHDYDDSCRENRLSENFNTAFPYEKHSQLPGFGGVYEVGTMANSYYLHQIGDVKYCVINLELSPRMEVLRWAGRICETYPDYRVIINTHAYLDETGNLLNTFSSESPSNYAWKSVTDASTSQEIYDELISKYENVFMAFCGHICSDDIMVRSDIGVNGNKITSMLVNGQASVYDEGIGEDMILIVKVNEKTKKMCCVYYSPSNDGVYNLQNQFEISFADAANPNVGL